MDAQADNVLLKQLHHDQFCNTGINELISDSSVTFDRLGKDGVRFDQ